MAKKINYKKATLVGLCWSIGYFAVVLYYTYMDLGFNLLSAAQWQSTYISFVNGFWAIDSKEGLLLLLTVLLFFPLWIIGWIVFYKVNWHLPFWMKRKEKTFKRELILNSNQNKMHMPVKLRLQNNRFKSLHPTETTEETPKSSDANSAFTPQMYISDDVEDILSLSKYYVATTFQNLLLGDQHISLAISADDTDTSSDDTTVLIQVLDKPGAAWTADLSENGEWYTAGEKISSPIVNIKRAAATLQELEPDSPIISALVLTQGELMDADSVVKYCADQGVYVLRFNEGLPETIPTLTDFMNDTFSQKEA